MVKGNRRCLHVLVDSVVVVVEYVVDAFKGKNCLSVQKQDI